MVQIKETITKLISTLLEPAVGRTRVVWLIKNGLLILSSVIVVWLLIMPLLNPVHERFNLNFSSIQQDASEKPKMLNPRFQGVDSSNQPFYITADSATQKSDEEVLLHNVNGDITTKDGGWASVKADYGTMFTERNELHLSSNVHLFTGDGYEFKTNKAIVYTDKNIIEGDEKIRGQGTTGVIHAGGFRVEDGGKKIIFNKRVKLTIYPGSEG